MRDGLPVAYYARRVVAGLGIALASTAFAQAAAQPALAALNRAAGVSYRFAWGTLGDAARLRSLIGRQLKVDSQHIHAYVLGEHGDSEVAAFSTVQIGGQPLAEFVCETLLDLQDLAAGVRDAAYRIVEGKGYTSFGIATAIVRICEAVVRDEHAVLPVSTWLDKGFGATDICLSLPCLIGAAGIERVLFPKLNSEEQSALLASAVKLTAELQKLDSQG